MDQKQETYIVAIKDTLGQHRNLLKDLLLPSSRLEDLSCQLSVRRWAENQLTLSNEKVLTDSLSLPVADSVLLEMII